MALLLGRAMAALLGRLPGTRMEPKGQPSAGEGLPLLHLVPDPARGLGRGFTWGLRDQTQSPGSSGLSGAASGCAILQGPHGVRPSRPQGRLPDPPNLVSKACFDGCRKAGCTGT